MNEKFSKRGRADAALRARDHPEQAKVVSRLIIEQMALFEARGLSPAAIDSGLLAAAITRLIDLEDREAAISWLAAVALSLAGGADCDGTA